MINFMLKSARPGYHNGNSMKVSVPEPAYLAMKHSEVKLYSMGEL